MKYCFKCGAELQGHERFCALCGADLSMKHETDRHEENFSDSRKYDELSENNLAKESQKDALKLNSPAPISDGGRSYNKIYLILALILGIGGTATGGIAGTVVGAIFGLMVGFCIKESILDLKLTKLRKQPFAIDYKIPYDELIQRLIPVLTPLNMTIEKDKKGNLVITYKKMIYDVSYREDNTFTIWWRKSPMRALFSIRTKISYYRQVVVAMGIIGYHIQQICRNQPNTTIHNGN